MSKKTRREAVTDDEGVSPVIAVILMVAITVVLAATVYVWVSGFAAEDTGPESAAATAKGMDLSGDGDVGWARITLTSGENAPYGNDDVTFSVTGASGEDVAYVCETAEFSPADEPAAGDPAECSADFLDGDKEWDVGENLWVPCTGEANHIVTVSVGGTAILDSSVSCDRDATA